MLSIPIMLFVKPFAVYFSKFSHDKKVVSRIDEDDNYIKADSLTVVDQSDHFKIRESIVKSCG